MGSHSRHIWKVESVRPAGRMGVAIREEETVVFGVRGAMGWHHVGHSLSV